jgi:hypothetical protein
MSIKDLYFQLSELRSENEDLKTQCEQFMAQQTWFTNQITTLQQNEANRIDTFLWHQHWFQEQLTSYQQQYGECFNNYMFTCKELVEVKDELLQVKQGKQGKQGKQEEIKVPLECNPEWALMLAEELESVKFMNRNLASTNRALKATAIELETQAEVLQSQVCTLKNSISLLESTLKKSGALQSTKEKEAERVQGRLLACQNELGLLKQKSQKQTAQWQQKEGHMKKAIDLLKEELEGAHTEAQNQKETIHRLQNNIVTLTEEVATNKIHHSTVYQDMVLATELSTGLNNKCLKLEEEYLTLSHKLRALGQQLDNQKESNLKLVKRAVGQEKLIRKLSQGMTVQFQVDKETTEQVISESCHEFFQEQQLKSDQTLALLAYALVHLKFVLETFHAQEEAQSAGDEKAGQGVFLQLVHHLERLFIIIPFHILLKHIDTMSELAVKHGINIRILHFLKYMLPKTAEDAIAGRQRVVLENYSELSSFFEEKGQNVPRNVILPLQGFMLLVGMSK